jgi:arabinosyltransferase C
LGTALAVLTPLLPVTQTTAQLNWPQNGVLNSVTAPRSAMWRPTSTSACRAAPPPASTAGKTVLLSTVPKQAPKAVDRGLLIQRANDDLVVVVRNTLVVVAPLSQVLSPACQS